MRARFALRAGLVLVLCCSLIEEPAAVVNQIDGLVVPVQAASPCPGADDNCIQTGLNLGEGINPPQSPPVPPGPVRAVLDASTGPETFLVPKTGASFNTVTFRLLEEGAGFENIFGWYNVDEPGKRYPVIFSCRGGQKSTYEPPVAGGGGVYSGGYVTSVSFQAEFTAGRYKGKQIGFYLVSPEDTVNEGLPGSNPRSYCATDPDDQGVLGGPATIDDDNFNEGDGHDDDNGFGRVYYTESKLNNDGNYVHYLIYQSKQNSQHFYFGFEDLFRGGDNDYDDTLVKVEGLVPTCQPQQEVCNGVDDNCNGQVDENLFKDCSNACGTGQAYCSFSNDGNPANDWVGCTAPTPTPEICDGKDNDCDGVIDDNVPSGGACVKAGCSGQLVCSGGTMICNAPSPTSEVCDGKDNDCNGKVDDLTRPCSTACGNGVESCLFSSDGNPANDWVGCSAPKPAPETCNGKDDDCNGTVDDNVPPGGACVQGGCTGKLVCAGGKMVCDAPSPTAEICDGKDNDCNGKIDDGVTRSCISACGAGVETCAFTDDGNPANDWVGCSAPKPGVETCNGKDDDCNGKVDDNLPPAPACTVGGCPGKMVCVGGKLSCDASPPSAEICDGKDNDCNGLIDENLIRSCMTGCGFGTEQCKFTDDGNPANDWVSCSAPQPQPEVCDGVDNDCNGVVDDKVAGEGAPCDAPSGTTCQKGKTKCVGGKLTCVGAVVAGPEVCDCKDNDCDGKVDEDAPCPGNSKCVECGCRIPCAGVEFGCPAGFSCKNGYCMPDKCAGVLCKDDEKCQNGACVSLCQGVSCPGGKVCRLGSCVENNCYGLGCPAGQVCLQNQCQPDPCAAVSCAAGEFCDHGQCKKSCGAVTCGRDAACAFGVCLRDPCAGVVCDRNVKCFEGKCEDACAAMSCASGQVCRKGACVDDPCSGVRCYGADESCQGGQCISPRTFIGERSELLATGAGGCACQAPAGSAPGAALWLLPALLLLARRRRLRVLLMISACAGALAACVQDPYVAVNLGDGGLPDSLLRPDVGECVKSNGGVEVCDGKDNDCNGKIDDGFNLQTDPKHCGSCATSCLNSVADPDCEHGKCRDLDCAPGFLDLNQDMKDGCEYECTPTGPEVCDGKDNDCNGKTDETFTLATDVANCGACGNACQLAHAVPRCEGGKCKIQSCEAGYLDKDKDPATGCESPCTKTNGGVEICDGKDNDCNGVVDDPGGKPIDFANDPFNCGACGVVCVIPNGKAECKNKGCVVASCTGKFVDADKDPQNGCECLPEGVEVCDNKDNNCNGQVDDGLVNLGSCGSSVGECKQGALVCVAGVPTCTGAVLPQPESCDGKDNDCNGVVDNNLPPLGICGSDVGDCQAGVLKCVLGAPLCEGAKGPSPELCDGKDNDCNGKVDDGLPALGPCGSSTGECKPGSSVCQNGVLACQGGVGPQPEVCDGKDNDCSGTADDNLPALGICGTSKGECKTGVNVCVGGQVVCQGKVDPVPETCDGKDNDCDGVVDNNPTGFPATCGSSTGECTAGANACVGGAVVCQGAVGPQPEMCDGKDNDCNGQNDPAACLWPGAGRERRLDHLSTGTLGAANSVQLHLAGSLGRLLAVWLDRRAGDRGDVYANLSSDGGRTWLAMDVAVDAQNASKAEPRAAFGGPSATSLRAYVAYEQFDASGQRDVYLRRSTDGGQSWAAPVAVEKVSPASGDALYVRLAVRPGASAADNDLVAVCWERIAVTGAINPNIRCNLSTDSGQSFPQNDVQVNATANNAFVPEIALDASYLYVTWQQGSLIRAARAALALPLAFGSESALTAQPGQEPRIGADGAGTVLVVWEDVRSPLIAIRANRSTNSGQSWLADGARVDLDVVDGDSISPAIAMRPGGRVFVAWSDTSRGQPDIYANFSDDGGMSWSAVARRVDGGTAGSRTSLAPAIAVSPSNQNVYVAWEDYRSGSQREIYATISLDNGVTWTRPDFRVNESLPAGAADARGPLVWASAGRLAVVWIDNRSGAQGSFTTGPNADIYSSYLE